MKIDNLNDIQELTNIIKRCRGDVWLQSIYGDRFNLKSELSAYIAFGALLEKRRDDLELFCSNPNDESLFFEYFSKKI